MKKGLILLIACSFTIFINAQQLLSKIPQNASVVATIKGENLVDLLSVKQFSKSNLGQILNEKLSKETKGEINDISDLGIDFGKDFHYFMDTKDRILRHCILIPLNNSDNFLNLFSEREKSKIIIDDTFSYLQEKYGDIILIWNSNTMLFMKITYQEFEGNEDVTMANGLEEVEVFEEKDANYYNSEAYKKEQAEKEAQWLKERVLREEREKALLSEIVESGKQILAGTYSKKSILSNSDYVKRVPGKKEEASFWINDFATLYSQAMRNYMYGRQFNPYSFLDIEKIYEGISATAILDFKEDAVAMEIQYAMNNDLAKWNKDMYSGSMNKSFVKYINEDHLLGYMSLNMNTAGILRAYPNIINHMFDVKSRSKETISETVALGTKLFSVLIDEEAAARIFKGDVLFLVTDLKEREVTYFDYKYDEEFNYTKVEKTKTENVPDFMVMFSSEEYDIYSRIMRIGVNENELIRHDNDIYEIKKLPKQFPLNIYITYKNNAVFIGSSIEDLKAIKTGKFVSKLSPKLKSSILSSSYSAYVNGKKIISQLPTNAFPRELRKKVNFLSANTEGMMINLGKMKGNTMKGEFIWNTPTKGHKNSFAYFINMIDALMK